MEQDGTCQNGLRIVDRHAGDQAPGTAQPPKSGEQLTLEVIS